MAPPAAPREAEAEGSIGGVGIAGGGGGGGVLVPAGGDMKSRDNALSRTILSPLPLPAAAAAGIIGGGRGEYLCA